MAVAVFFSHSYSLSGNPTLLPLSNFFNAKVAVESFFVISGFLIFMSYENCRSIGDYFQKRARRIYPAYLTVILLCALFGAFVSSLPLRSYFTTPLWKYLAANLVFLNYLARSLPGVFTANRFPDVNGALWTIKVEVMFYFSVPLVVALMRKWGRLLTLALIYGLSLLFLLYCIHTGSEELAKQLPAQMCFFVGGALFFYYFHQFEKVAKWVLAGAVAITLIESALHVTVLYPLCLAAIILYAACFVPALTKYRPKWDLSYGVYIFHFPVLQLLVSLGFLSGNPLWGVVMAGVIVVALATVSWNAVEKRFLTSRRHGSAYAAAAAKAY